MFLYFDAVYIPSPGLKLKLKQPRRPVAPQLAYWEAAFHARP